MHAISSYHGNRPANKQTHNKQTHKHTHTNRQDQLQYTAQLSLAHSVIIIRQITQ